MTGNDTNDPTAGAQDPLLSLSHSLVAERQRFVQLSRQHKRRQYALHAERESRARILAWNTLESSDDKRTRLENRIEQIEKELRHRRSKRAICQGSLEAKLASSVVSSSSFAFPACVCRFPQLPSILVLFLKRHTPSLSVVQSHIAERDQISFRLLAIEHDLAEVKSMHLDTRKQLLSLNRENVAVVKALRQHYRAASEIMQAATHRQQSRYHQQQDEILVLKTRLAIISPVLQSLICESPLSYFSRHPKSPEELRSAAADRLALDEDRMASGDDGQDKRPTSDTSTDRWMGLMLLAGEDWDEEWDPLVEGKGTEDKVEPPKEGND
ncbi:hypothetical protein JCM3766R1_001944 [Sporobolomyces carnicolor]